MEMSIAFIDEFCDIMKKFTEGHINSKKSIQNYGKPTVSVSPHVHARLIY